jgi:uncharacterized protein (DUF433 family)
MGLTMPAEAPTLDVRYTTQGAAFLLQTKPATLKSWANGYLKSSPVGPKAKASVLQSDRGEHLYFNFQEVVELMFVRELVRKRKAENGRTFAYASLDEVREMSLRLSASLGQYPFAKAQLVDAIGEIATEKVESGSLINPKAGQYLLDYAIHVKKELEFVGDLATVWYPSGTDRKVKVDCRLRWGLPIVNSGVPTQAIFERYKLEDQDAESTADWFDIPQDEVTDAVHFEEVWSRQSA